MYGYGNGTTERQNGNGSSTATEWWSGNPALHGAIVAATGRSDDRMDRFDQLRPCKGYVTL